MEPNGGPHYPSAGGGNASSGGGSNGSGGSPDSAPAHPGSAATAAAKRSRVVLSCGPCRASKLKCDRFEPCGQCLKKSRPECCVYAPKSVKQKPAKGMAARLKRLEGMVRTMMDEGAGVVPRSNDDAAAAAASAKEEEAAQPGGQFVQGERATTYVGATHFMAILEDIEDMKNYFEVPEVAGYESPEQTDELEPPDLILHRRNCPWSRADLFRLLPERKVADRLVRRYFSSPSPSQNIVHRPTFVKQYAQFWNDPYGTSFHWLSLLFMILSLGVFYSSFFAPHELSGDTPPQDPLDRSRLLRNAAAWCLVWGKYTQPSIATIPPFILFVEAEFITSRSAQTDCYVLSSVCLRLLLKMGLHRDPSKLANISAFEGEMRRRMWNMAVQIDMLVSFHMGLPSMISSIEYDTEVPRHLIDEDFGEDTVELPPPRPMTDYTDMTYPIVKSRLMRVFAEVAKQAHILTPPPYSEIRRIDALIHETWAQVPHFMLVKPLEECITTPPMQITHRFGLAVQYNKTRCVLHRRFLVEPILRPEHDYSRRQCLEGAMTILDFQSTISQACQPGGVLNQQGWIVSSVAAHDFLLAATIVYLAIGNDQLWNGGDGGSGSKNNWMDDMSPRPTRELLLNLLQSSYTVWINFAMTTPDVKTIADVLGTMLSKLGSTISSPQKDSNDGGVPVSAPPPLPQQQQQQYGRVPTSEGSSSHYPQSLTNLSISNNSAFPSSSSTHLQALELAGSGAASHDSDLGRGWIAVGSEMDWRYMDNIMSQTNASLVRDEANPSWFDQGPALDDFGFSAFGAWDPSLDHHQS